MTRQSLTIDAKMQGGSWAIARHIRCKAPWLAPMRIRSPINTFFESARTGAGVDVYVVDSGLRYTHQEFGGRGVFVGGVYGSGGVDDHGHGTRTAGQVGGATTGFARGASLRVVKCLDENNASTSANIAAGIDLARADYLSRAGTNRPAVVNLSLRASDPSLVDPAVAACIDAGMVVVASANNFRSSTIQSPGNSPDVICVGGIRANDTPYYTGNAGTNWGERVDILAASERVWTADWTADDAYRTSSGTSAGTAVVSGVVACLLQGRSRLTTRGAVQAVRADLIAAATTERFVPQPHFGIGVLPSRILYFNPYSVPPNDTTVTPSFVYEAGVFEQGVFE